MHGTLEAHCCGLLQLGIPRGFLKEPFCPSSTGNLGAKAPQCQRAVLGEPWGSRKGMYLLLCPENSSNITNWMKVFSWRGAIAQLTAGREHLCAPWGGPGPHVKRGRAQGSIRALGDGAQDLS